MIYRLERFFYYLLLLLIPIQLGKHFWPNFAFVQAIRVDYISPTLYVSDIAVFFLLIFFLFRTKLKIRKLISNKLFIGALVVLLLGLITAISKESVLLGIIKFIELSFVAFYTATEVQKKDIVRIISFLALGALIQFILVVFQLISQQSLGGAFYYLGERTFSRSTPGIALFSFQNDLWLRPYGSFPHPNVLGFYFFTVFFFIVSLAFSLKDKMKRNISFAVALIMAIGIVLSFSRVLILLLFIFFPLFFLLNNRRKYVKELLVAVCLCALLVLFFLLPRFTQTLGRDFLYRIELVKIAWKEFLFSPFIGVGINNFYYHEIIFQKTISPTLLQPVHNIYLLILAQTGVFGLILGGVFVKRFFNSLQKKVKEPFFKGVGILMLSVSIIGVFDHFLLTLQQGQLLLALLIGFGFSKVRE